MPENSPDDDVIAILTRDHREVQELFDELDKTREHAGPKQRKDLVDLVTGKLVRHSVAEEQFLYPAIRLNVTDGAESADQRIGEHELIERVLKELEGMRATDASFEAALQRLMELVTAHIAEEERTLFPRLRSVCTAEDLVEIGKMVRVAKKLAPTRPHPDAPDTPPGNLTAPAVGLIDRIRDALTGRGRGS